MEQQNIKGGLQGLAEKIRAMKEQGMGEGQKMGGNPLIQFCKQNGLGGPCSPDCIQAALKQGGELAELAKQAQSNCK